ncbi:MAG: hypothetical protein RI947_640 [Candidatus Parcubacteria bacterium]|jgi:HEPN domain-containing protein
MALIIKPLTFALCKKIARKRLSEARLLLSSNENSGAYYLAGYAIELALKACYCKQVGKYSYPPERKIYDQLYTHDLNQILTVSGVKPLFDNTVQSNTKLQSAWEVAKDWSEKTRYHIISKSDAKDMVASVEIIVGWIETLW